MSLTYPQRVATALHMVDSQLQTMLSALVFSDEDFDEALCADHCGDHCGDPRNCVREEADRDREINDARRAVADAVAVLRIQLARHAQANGVRIPQ